MDTSPDDSAPPVAPRDSAHLALEARVRRQEAVAEIGQRALSGTEFGVLLRSVVTTMAAVLRVEFCTILELVSGEDRLAVRAGVGWDEHVVGSYVPAGLGSQAGFTLLTAEPVLLRDLEQEDRFDMPDFVRRTGIASGISVVIGGARGPYGVLGAHSTGGREFTRDDVHFMQSVANILAATVQRVDAEEQLRASRDQLAGVLSAVDDGITVQSRDGSLVYVNAAAARMTGYAGPEALVGSVAGEVVRLWHMVDVDGNPVDPEDLPGRRVLRTGRVSESVVRFRHITTSEDHWSMIRSSPVFGDDGAVEYAVTVFRDITEQQRADQERLLLLEREREARAQAESTRERVAFLASASEILASSLDYETTLQNVARLAVPSLGDWCTFDVLETDGTVRRIALTHPDPDKIRMARELEERYPAYGPEGPDPASPLASGQSILMPDLPEELLVASAVDDDHLTILRELGLHSAIAVPLIARDRILGMLTLIHAESGRRHTEEDLALAEDLARRAAVAVDNARLFAEAQRALQLRDEFLSIASHELKTPLTALQLQAQLIQRLVDAGNTDRIERAVVGVGRQVRQLTRLTNDLLDVSRIGAGRLDISPQDTDLAQLVQEVVDRFLAGNPELAERVHLDLQPVSLSVDGFRIDQVVTNLFSNAMKYGRAGPIEITVSSHGTVARITVRDEGIGIAPEDLPRIFNRFERTVPARNYGGLGLGLYIARQIVEAHGGTTRVHSTHGVGSTFIVELPLDRSAAEQEGPRTVPQRSREDDL